MYESPIEIIQHKIQADFSKRLEEDVLYAVVRTDIHVDREELIKALRYDRGQYEKGFQDGKADATEWISVKDGVPDGEVLAANFAPGTYGYKEYIIGYVSKVKCTEPGWYKGKCYAENDHEIIDNVTHWMPLPEPPKLDI